jgi:hypothetical protein
VPHCSDGTEDIEVCFNWFYRVDEPQTWRAGVTEKELARSQAKVAQPFRNDWSVEYKEVFTVSMYWYYV